MRTIFATEIANRIKLETNSLSFLEHINSPADLKKLSRDELPLLAEEIRMAIVEVVSQTGGHLAPSLGAVELAIAIHYVFDTPREKVIWDVGHQAYAHKLLTGRRDQFNTLRQFKGISGFTRRSESPYDAFSTGHSSTSISASLGIACAKDLKDEDAKVIAVIGDGSMTAGIAFEGLNQAGDTLKDKNLLVILNDNEMSIAPPVGALSSYLSRLYAEEPFQDLKAAAKGAVAGVTTDLMICSSSLRRILDHFLPTRGNGAWAAGARIAHHTLRRYLGLRSPARLTTDRMRQQSVGRSTGLSLRKKKS